MKKYIVSLYIVFLLLNVNGFSSSGEDFSNETCSLCFSFSLPIITEVNNHTTIAIEETEVYTLNPNYPKLPKFVKTITFPKGTIINSVTGTIHSKNGFTLNTSINLVDTPRPYGQQDVAYSNQLFYPVSQTEENWANGYYPTRWLTHNLGAGLQNEMPVLFLTLNIFPVQYCKWNQSIRSIESITVYIDYTPVQNKSTLEIDNPIDLIVIGPENFSNPVQALLMHKQQIGISAEYVTIESIYNQYSGRDKAEKIKYCIEEKVSTCNTRYVLIMGSIYQVPIRTSNTSIFGRWSHSVLSDLYYADLYDENESFCSWDSNNDGVYGETDVDKVDLYPDVHVGRFACDSVEEVSVVVDKIMVYEQNTFGEDWYNNMVFIGGNTFPGFIFNRGNEGEEHNLLIMSIMDDFTPSSVIWTSKHNFNPISINHAINKGAGFVDYSGHGFEHGMGTYRPHGRRLQSYLTPFVFFLRNGYELPVIFFDACLTAKLDFVLQDVLDYKPYRLFDIAFKLARANTSIKLPCFAWSFVKHDAGGAVATIGATRTAFGGEDFGCEKLSTEFFSAYRRGIKLGEMFSAAQTAYIHDLPNDEFTVEEFLLLGDPSLQLGGYSEDTEPPSITVQNPVENAIHIRGIPVLPRFISVDKTSVYGGFRRKPVQISVEDNVDSAKDINVYLKVNNKIDTKLTYNDRTGYYETEWTGFGWNLFTMNISAIDRTGNKASISRQINYHCFFPLINNI